MALCPCKTFTVLLPFIVSTAGGLESLFPVSHSSTCDHDPPILMIVSQNWRISYNPHGWSYASKNNKAIRNMPCGILGLRRVIFHPARTNPHWQSTEIKTEPHCCLCKSKQWGRKEHSLALCYQISGSEKKLLIVDIFMVIASAWSLNVTEEKEKADWLLLDRGYREVGTHQWCPRSPV